MGFKNNEWGRVGRGFLSHMPIFRRIASRPFTDHEEGKEYRHHNFFCLYSRHDFFHSQERGEDVMHTSVWGEMGTSWASIMLKSDSWAVCGDGA